MTLIVDSTPSARKPQAPCSAAERHRSDGGHGRGSGATVASYRFGTPDSSLINDVALTKDGAWFTDSFQAQLYFVPVSRAGVPGPTFRTLALSGPAADRHRERGGQPQRHPGHPQRHDPGRGPLGQRPAGHGRSGHRRQRDHRRGQCAQRRRDRAGGGAAVGGAELQQPGEPDPAGARTSALGWWRRSSPARCSRSRPPRPALAVAWRWSTPSSTPASHPPPTSTR